jgi:hypothetical protein
MTTKSTVCEGDSEVKKAVKVVKAVKAVKAVTMMLRMSMSQNGAVTLPLTYGKHH